ncbi:hypothetical protein PBMFNG_PBMFNG_08100, partial [Dysosmobacter welbionis]
LRCQGQLIDGHARGMEHSVPDSRCLWDHGRLSQCFVPKGGGGLIGLHKL